MGASVEEALMAAGSWSLDCDYAEDLANALLTLPGPHLLLWWGERLFYCGPVFSAVIGKRGILLAGRGLIIWLGSGSDGPVIVDREYLASNDRLGNGGFELGDLYWKLAEGTKWVIGTAGPVQAGAWSAVMSAKAVGGDDTLASAETFETRSGDSWLAFAQAELVDGTSVGGIRLRLVLEGQFRPQNLVVNGDFAGGNTHWSYSTNAETGGAPPAAGVVGGELRLGPVPQRQVLSNPKFALSLADWNLGGPTHWYLDDQHPFSPAYSCTTASTPTSSSKYIWTTASLGSGPGGLIQPGERYRLDANILPTPSGVDGEAYAAVDYARPTGEGGFDLVRAETQRVRATDNPGSWRNVSAEFDSETYQAPTVWVYVLEHTAEYWSVDDVYLTRIEGNEVVAENDPVAVVPGLSHDMRATVRSAVDGQAGSVVLRVRLSAPGRPDVTIVVASTEHTQGQAHRVEGSFTPPSGYDTARLQIVGKDILGSYFAIDDVDIRQNDAGVIVRDGVLLASAAGGGWNAIGSAVIVPAGTDRVRLEVVAEEGTAWAVDSVVMGRLSASGLPTTGDIVRELLVHPDTGLPLLAEGDITDADNLVYDWRILQLTNLAALQHLSRSGVASPVREWRVNPDGTLDWGTAEEIFEDRDQLVFAGESLVVLDEPDVTISAEGRVEKVRVIGAERRKPDGDRTNLTGEADNDPGGAVDFFGNPVARTRVVSDAQVDHPGYAAALARYQADQAAAAPESSTLLISDWSAEQDFAVGDWVYLHKPEAGLEDPDNERVANDGQVVFPARRRVIARTLRCGPGFRAELRMPDGTTLPLAVRWEPKTSAQIEVGVPKPEFLTDPQAGPAGVQFMRFRASMPR